MFRYTKQLKFEFYKKLIYVSSAVEEIDVTEKQVEDIVKNDHRSMFLQNNPTEGVLQAYGQKMALDCIEKWAKEDCLITTNYLLELHNVVFEKIDPKAGRYREKYVKLRDSELQPSFPYAISGDILEFNDWLVKNQALVDTDALDSVVEFISTVYHDVTRIHPFSDGNGRTARLFVNLFLRRFGYPPILIPKVDNDETMRLALRMADMGDIQPLVKMNRKFLTDSVNLVTFLKKA